MHAYHNNIQLVPLPNLTLTLNNNQLRSSVHNSEQSSSGDPDAGFDFHGNPFCWHHPTAVFHSPLAVDRTRTENAKINSVLQERFLIVESHADKIFLCFVKKISYT